MGRNVKYCFTILIIYFLVHQMQKCQQRLFDHYGISLISLKPMPNINERSRLVSSASTAASHAGDVQCALDAEVEVPPFPVSVSDERESVLTTDDLRELTRVLERLGDAASALELYADALVYYRHSVHCATAAARHRRRLRALGVRVLTRRLRRVVLGSCAPSTSRSHSATRTSPPRAGQQVLPAQAADARI